MRYTRVAALAAGLVLAASAAGVGGAVAKPLDKGTYDEPVSFVDGAFCGVNGLEVSVEGRVQGRFVGVRRGSDGLAYYVGPEKATYTYASVADPDLVVTEVLRTLFKDHTVTDNGDGTLSIVVLATGNATVYGPDGKAIARNPGQLRFELLIDNGGTPEDPFDDEFIEFVGVVRDSTGRNDDFCSAVVPVLEG